MGTKVLSRLSYAEIGAVLAISLVVEHSALAQTVPTDLLDLSIEDLFDANVVSEADRSRDKAQVAPVIHLCDFRVRRVLPRYASCFLRRRIIFTGRRRENGQ